MITLPGTRVTRWLALPCGWLRYRIRRLRQSVERAYLVAMTWALELRLRLRGVEPPPEPKPIDVAWPEGDQ